MEITYKDQSQQQMAGLVGQESGMSMIRRQDEIWARGMWMDLGRWASRVKIFE